MTKMAKRIIAVFSLLCVCVMMLCSCGDPEKTLVGKWTLYGNTWGFKFNDDGTGETFGGDGDYSFTWEKSSEYKDPATKTEYTTKSGYDGIIVITKTTDGQRSKLAYYYRYGESDKVIFLADVTWNDDKKDERYVKD